MLQILLDNAQILLDDDKALVDEVGGVDGNLVLVLDRLLVVDGDNRIQDILCLDWRVILQRQRQNRSLLLNLTDGKIRLIVANHRLNRNACDVNLLVEPRAVHKVCWGKLHIARRGLDRVLQAPREDFTLGSIGKIAQLNHIALAQRSNEADILLLVILREGQRNRRACIALVVAQAILNLVAHVGVQALDYVAEEVLRAETINLVGHIDLVDEIIVTVETCRIAITTLWILDDNGRRAEIYKRRA